MIFICLTCRKEFVDNTSRKFCSYNCYWKYLKGKPSWNKGIKGVMKPNSGSFKKGLIPWNKGKTGIVKFSEESRKLLRGIHKGEKHWIWKGDKVGYRALHHWVDKWLGKPAICKHCGKKRDKPRSIQWANIDHKYRRNLDDFIPLCPLCHRKYDEKNNLTHRYY